MPAARTSGFAAHCNAHRPAARPQVHASAARVTLCCALSELAHAQQAGTDLGVEAYREYEEALRQDLAQVGGYCATSSERFAVGARAREPGALCSQRLLEPSDRARPACTPPAPPCAAAPGGAKARAAAGLPVPREDGLKISVRHVPLHLAALEATAFVLPAAGAAAGMAT
jgi:hypothetical protein